MLSEMINEMVKVALWEETKGKLRAIVRLSGTYSRGGSDKFGAIHQNIEEFIKNFEANGFHE